MVAVCGKVEGPWASAELVRGPLTLILESLLFGQINRYDSIAGSTCTDEIQVCCKMRQPNRHA